MSDKQIWILAIFQNAGNEHKKTGNLFLISCLGVALYAATVIQFSIYCLLHPCK